MTKTLIVKYRITKKNKNIDQG